VTDDDTFTYEMRIEAPPEVVFPYFTDPERMGRWIGIGHRLDPVPGGVLEIDINPKTSAMGQYVEIDPPKRVVFTFGWNDHPSVPPGSTTVEVTLTDDGGATRVHFAHRGLPSAEQREQHAQGWGHFLARLEIAGAGGDAGADPMAQVQP
jgi:uncharacterized protein YndB with AHSA1/START domain